MAGAVGAVVPNVLAIAIPTNGPVALDFGSTPPCWGPADGDYFSSRVTLAAGAGAASIVTGAGSALRIRLRTAA